MKADRTKIIPASWDLPTPIHRRFGQHAGRQRAMAHDGHLLLVLHEVPEPGVPERTAILAWRHPEGAWRSSEPTGVKGLLDRYTEVIDALEDRLQEASDARPLFEILRTVNPLRRSLHNLQVTLQEAREKTDDRELISLRDRAQDLARAADLLAEETRAAMEYELASAAEEQNRIANQLAKSGHQLNLLAAMFFPLTAIASMFGMNMPSGLEHSGTWLFWTTLSIGLIVGLVLRARVNRQ